MMSDAKALNYYAEGYEAAVRVVKWSPDSARVARDWLDEVSRRIVEHEMQAYHAPSPRERRKARREYARLYAVRLGFLDGYRCETGIDLAVTKKDG